MHPILYRTNWSCCWHPVAADSGAPLCTQVWKFANIGQYVVLLAPLPLSQEKDWDNLWQQIGLSNRPLYCFYHLQAGALRIIDVYPLAQWVPNPVLLTHPMAQWCPNGQHCFLGAKEACRGSSQSKGTSVLLGHFQKWEGEKRVGEGGKR